MAIGVATGSHALELDGLRVPGGLMLAGGIVRGFLPHAPGLPCPLRSLTGIPCPLCGMTTSVTDVLHLHIGSALAANPAGLVAVAMAVWVITARHRHTLSVPGWLLPAALVAMWGFELVRFQIL